MYLSFDPALPLWEIHPENTPPRIGKYIYTRLFIETLITIANNWNNLYLLYYTQKICENIWYIRTMEYSVQFSSVAQSCPTLRNPMNHSTPGLPVHHQLPEFTQTQVHRVCDAIQPCHPLSSPSPLAPNPSQHQSLFQWVNSSHEVAKVLEFQL